jgi:hypothetical protein
MASNSPQTSLEIDSSPLPREHSRASSLDSRSSTSTSHSTLHNEFFPRISSMTLIVHFFLFLFIPSLDDSPLAHPHRLSHLSWLRTHHHQLPLPLAFLLPLLSLQLMPQRLHLHANAGNTCSLISIRHFKLNLRPLNRLHCRLKSPKIPIQTLLCQILLLKNPNLDRLRVSLCRLVKICCVFFFF